MAASSATTVAEYLAELPPDRRAVVVRVRDVVRANLPAGYEEAMGWGMICWGIPLSRYPDTYHGRPLGYVALAAQKNYFALYLSLYMDPRESAAFARAFEATGRKLDMGKSCLRFRTLEDLPLDLIGREVARMTPDEYIALYERSRGAATKKPAGKKSIAKKSAVKKTTARKSATKQPAAKKKATRAAAKRT